MDASLMSSAAAIPRIEPLVHDERRAARLLGIPVSTLVRWRKIGRGPDFTRVGRRICYQVDDLRRWLSSNRCSPAEALQARVPRKPAAEPHTHP
jgi:hypothetical protein